MYSFIIFGDIVYPNTKIGDYKFPKMSLTVHTVDSIYLQLLNFALTSDPKPNKIYQSELAVHSAFENR